jgi:sirohydrochlorin ferrochelatase
VAHGERGGAGVDRLVQAVANKLKAQGRHPSVQACFISKEPTLQSVLGAMPRVPITVCPVFMSRGYFVNRAIPDALAYAGYGPDTNPPAIILDPVGLHPQLPQLVAELALSTLEASGLSARDCRLLLVAHGSKIGKASHQATSQLAAGIEGLQVFAGIEQSFLEEKPFLDEQLTRIECPVVVVGLFTGESIHGADELREAIKSSAGADILLSLPLARWPLLKELICDDLTKDVA